MGKEALQSMGFLKVLLQIPVYLAPESTPSLRDAELGDSLLPPSLGLAPEEPQGPGSAGIVCDPCLHGAQGPGFSGRGGQQAGRHI